MYADDTKLLKNLLEIVLPLQNDLNAISLCADSWQLTLNPAKTKHLRRGRHIEDCIFYLNGSAIGQVNSMCDIGVFVESDLKFNIHCNSLVKRAHFCIPNILTLPKGVIFFFISLYCTNVRPILEYATSS